jgi:hypothetical protein
VLPRAPSLEELLEAITVGRASADGRDEPEAPWVEAPPRRPGFPLAGCLVRLVGLGFLLVAVVIIFLLMLFGGFIIN